MITLTFVHCSSESGDNYYFVLDGIFNDTDDILPTIIKHNAYLTDETLYLEHHMAVWR